MNASSTTGTRVDAINVAPGNGVLVRRATSILYVAESPAAADSLVRTFTGAEEHAAADAVTDASIAAGFDVPPFALLTWDERVRLVVQGALEVRTDDPALPMLSGAGSDSWVERSLRLSDAAVVVTCGAPADPATDLQLGRVLADGFSIRFRAIDAADRTRDAPPADAAATTLGTDAAAQPVDTAPQPQPSEQHDPDDHGEPVAADQHNPSTADPTRAMDRMAALRAALGNPDANADVPPAAQTDSERGVTPVHPETPPPVPTAPETVAPPGPEVDDEVTIAPGDSPPDSDDRPPFVSALRCPRGHLNPPHVGACRVCGDLMPPASQVEVVAQPPLALLQLDDGETLPVDRSLVLGRKPERDGAQADQRARLVTVGTDTSVSRTHARIDVEDWTLTVTDCGSRSGTAIVSRPGEEPRVLDPWVPHELPVDARLFLGGPTSVVVRAVPGSGPR